MYQPRPLALAALLLSSASCFAAPQAATPPPGQGEKISKPSPYEGVSQPPADDVIRATEETPSPLPSAAAPAPPPAAAVPAPPPAAGTGPVVSGPAVSAPRPDPDGIVEVPVTDEDDQMPAQPANAKELHLRPIYNPDANIVTSVPTPDNQLPEGTPIHAKLDRELSSAENGIGTPFTAQVSRDVVQNGRVIIPVGSLIQGRVTHADYGHRFAGPATLRLSPDAIVLPDGTRYTLHAIVSLTDRTSNTRVNSEGTVESKDHAKRIAAEYVIGAGSGAVTGAVVAGPTGAIVGTAIGLGVVTAHWLLENHAAVLPADSDITFGLSQPLILTASSGPAPGSR